MAIAAADSTAAAALRTTQGSCLPCVSISVSFISERLTERCASEMEGGGFETGAEYYGHAVGYAAEYAACVIRCRTDLFILYYYLIIVLAAPYF